MLSEMSDHRKNSASSISSCDSRSSREKKFTKIFSLFEIPRPNKNNRKLKRTASLPSKNRPPVLDAYLEDKKMEHCIETSSETGEQDILPFQHGHVKMLKEKLEKARLEYPGGDCEAVNSSRHFQKNKRNRPYSVFEAYGYNISENVYEEIPEHPPVSNKPRSRSVDTEFEIEDENNEDTERVQKIIESLEGSPSTDYDELYSEVTQDYTSLYENLPFDPDLHINATDQIANIGTASQYEDTDDTLTTSQLTLFDAEEEKNSQYEDTDYVALTNDPDETSDQISSNDVFSSDRTSSNELLVPHHFKRVKSNRISGRSPHKKSSKEIIAKRKGGLCTDEEIGSNVSVKHRISQFENFYKAEEKGETENFRKSLVLEMTKVEELMKRDGYSSDDNLEEDLDVEHNIECNKFFYNEEEERTPVPIDENEVIYDIPFEFRDTEDQLESNNRNSEDHYEAPPIIVEETQETENTTPYYSFPDDEFGEILFAEDLENGLYFVEAYNADNKELVIATIQVDRHCVYPNNISNVPVYDVLAEQGDDSNKTLVLLNQLLHSTSETSLNESSGSKRTTIYSTTSGDSLVSFEDLKLEDDEGIDVHSKHNSLYNQYNNARRETYCDNEGVVRIERIYVEPSDLESPKPNKYFSGFDELYDYEYVEFAEPIRDSLSETDIKKDRLDYLLEEILVTEIKYVDDLRKIVEEYKPFIQTHPDPSVSNKTKDIFGNIEELYEKQQDFLHELKLAEGNLLDILKAFIDSEHLFKLYPKYIGYKLKANLLVKELDSIIKERQEQMNEKLNISAYLVTPVQRLGKYKLFLESILNQLQKESKPIGTATMALEIIRKEMSNGNDAAAISSIQGCPIYQFGSFIMREKFMCIKPKRMELMVFLFEEVIVFATEDPKTIDLFFFYQSIKMSDLRIATFDDNNLQLIDYPKTKRRSLSTWKYTFILEAKSQKIKETWRQAIEGILWKQLQTLKESTLQRSKHRSSKKKTKTSSSNTLSVVSAPETTTSRAKSVESTSKKERRERIKSTGSAKFYV